MDQPTSDQLSRVMQCSDDFARREPLKAVVSAFGAGFLINLLPLGAIAAALVGIAMALVRPALLLLGLVKACELCRVNLPAIPSTVSSHD